jgi:TonB family protein
VIALLLGGHIAAAMTSAPQSAAVPASQTAPSSPGVPPRLKGDVAASFGVDNYPPQAIRAGEQGKVAMVLSVDADGRTTACKVATSSGSISLDSTSCALALRVAFEPARDATGAPVAAEYPLVVRWVLPKSAHSEGAYAVTISLNSTSEPHCTIMMDDRLRSLTAEFCRALHTMSAKQGADLSRPQTVEISADMLAP